MPDVRTVDRPRQILTEQHESRLLSWIQET